MFEFLKKEKKREFAMPKHLTKEEQEQVREIIKKAQEIFPDIELKLSTLEEYVDDFIKLVDK